MRQALAVAVAALVTSGFTIPLGVAEPGPQAGSLRSQIRSAIASITVSPGTTGPDVCAGQPADAVLLVDSCESINSNTYGSLGTLSDEHSTILPPGTLGTAQTDYLFFVASHTSLNTTSSGLVVLSAGGPDRNGRWHLSFAPGYGEYDPSNPNPGRRYGQLFLSPMLHPDCPTASPLSARDQNPTFDLNYADPGEVVVDPTKPPHGDVHDLLMVYEGSNRCVGLAAGNNLQQGPPDSAGNPTANNFYAMVGIATSTDGGMSWPAYSYDEPNALPNQNLAQGPPASDALGAIGTGICAGDTCGGPLPAGYGRYAVLGPPTSIAQAMTNPTVDSHGYLAANTGDAAPSAFADDVAGSSDPYLYVVSDYLPGEAALGNTSEPPGTNPNSDLVVSRARLNPDAEPLAFSQFDGASFGPPSRPGTPNTAPPSPIFQPGRNDWSGSYQNCQDAQPGAVGLPEQLMTEAQISYVDATDQYLLTFVCRSDDGDPATGADAGKAGASWFYATTTNLDTQNWSVPEEIGGSWHTIPPGGCGDFDGWYPSFMSLSTPSSLSEAGHLDTTGWAFYLDGCQGVGDATPGGRQYSVRTFTIHTAPQPTRDAESLRTVRTTGDCASDANVGSRLRPPAVA